MALRFFTCAALVVSVEARVQPEAIWGTIVGMVGALLLWVVCTNLYKIFCPRDSMFSKLELDEIRLERIDERESFLKGQMNAIQNRLTSYRRKKTEMSVQREISNKIEERVAGFNEKGQSIYGDQWNSGEVPIQDVLSIPENEMRQLRIEATNIITARKAEEEKDLWHLWNTDKDKTKRGQNEPLLSALEAGSSSSSQWAGQDSRAGNRAEVLTSRTNREAQARQLSARLDPEQGRGRIEGDGSSSYSSSSLRGDSEAVSDPRFSSAMPSAGSSQQPKQKQQQQSTTRATRPAPASAQGMSLRLQQAQQGEEAYEMDIGLRANLRQPPSHPRPGVASRPRPRPPAPDGGFVRPRVAGQQPQIFAPPGTGRPPASASAAGHLGGATVRGHLGSIDRAHGSPEGGSYQQQQQPKQPRPPQPRPLAPRPNAHLVPPVGVQAPPMSTVQLAAAGKRPGSGGGDGGGGGRPAQTASAVPRALPGRPGIPPPRAPGRSPPPARPPPPRTPRPPGQARSPPPARPPA